MADRRRMASGQQPPMGPPETPSRVMQASPNLFPSLQFSPDLFSAHSMSPSTAPIYPQQMLFWDHHTAPPPQSTMTDPGYNPYQDTWDTSFTPTTNTVPGFTPLATQDQIYDLPMQPQSAGPFFEAAGFPAPFHTSPRNPPPQYENPAEFLSSPARRFGGAPGPATVQPRRPIREIPAYYHQMQESKREMELEKDKRRKRAVKQADDEMLMNSVRRALTPSKPGLQRSFTHSGITVPQGRTRHYSRPSFNDAASTSSAASNPSSRTGRSSPLKRTSSAAGLGMSGTSQKPRTTVSLAIDEHGLAKTVLEDLQESDTDLDDGRSVSVASSMDEGDFHALHSQTNSFAFDQRDSITGVTYNPATVRKISRTHDKFGSESAKRMDRLSLNTFVNPETARKHTLDDTIRQPKRALHVDPGTDKGDAQKALRAIIQDRSRSTSTLDEYPSSRHSDSSVQFHSSPPVHQGPFGGFPASPATVTDPELATPGTDQETFASGQMRCICKSSIPDSTVIQCDICTKWLHAICVGMDRPSSRDPYICIYCDGTPLRHPGARGSSMRAPGRGNGGQSASPLAHKSTRGGQRR